MHMKKMILAVLTVLGSLAGVGDTEAYTVNITPVQEAPQFAVLDIPDSGYAVCSTGHIM